MSVSSRWVATSSAAASPLAHGSPSARSGQWSVSVCWSFSTRRTSCRRTRPCARARRRTRASGPGAFSSGRLGGARRLCLWLAAKNFRLRAAVDHLDRNAVAAECPGEAGRTRRSESRRPPHGDVQMRRVGDFRPPAPLAVDHRSPERHPPDHSGDDDARAATLLEVEHRQAGRMSGMDATSARLGRHRMMLSAYARAAALRHESLSRRPDVAVRDAPQSPATLAFDHQPDPPADHRGRIVRRTTHRVFLQRDHG
jgi:hypothetical protein